MAAWTLVLDTKECVVFKVLHHNYLCVVVCKIDLCLLNAKLMT